MYGVIRRASTFNTERIDHIYQDPHESGRRLRLLYGDLNDASSLNKILRDVQPDEIYNLGAQSHVRVSFDIPEYTAEVDAPGRSGCSRRYAKPGCAGRGFIRPRRRSFSERSRRSRSAKRPRFIRAALTASPNFTLTGSR